MLKESSCGEHASDSYNAHLVLKQLWHEYVSLELFLSFHLTEGSGVQIVLQCLIADLCAKYSAAFSMLIMFGKQVLSLTLYPLIS